MEKDLPLIGMKIVALIPVESVETQKETKCE